jgi:hypothetical protein
MVDGATVLARQQPCDSSPSLTRQRRHVDLDAAPAPLSAFAAARDAAVNVEVVLLAHALSAVATVQDPNERCLDYWAPGGSDVPAAAAASHQGCGAQAPVIHKTHHHNLQQNHK